MTAIETIKVFEEKHVRTVWDDAQEQWYVSIVDVIEILTGSDRPRKCWSDLKNHAGFIRYFKNISWMMGEQNNQAWQDKLWTLKI